MDTKVTVTGVTSQTLGGSCTDWRDWKEHQPNILGFELLVVHALYTAILAGQLKWAFDIASRAKYIITQQAKFGVKGHLRRFCATGHRVARVKNDEAVASHRRRRGI